MALPTDNIGCTADMAAHRIRCFELAVQLSEGSAEDALLIAEKLLALLYKAIPTSDDSGGGADSVLSDSTAEPSFEVAYPRAEVASEERLLGSSAIGRTKVWVTPLEAYQANAR